MNGKRLERAERKERKMAAMLRLSSEPATSTAMPPTSNHEQMIRDLELAMGCGSDKRKATSGPESDVQEPAGELAGNDEDIHGEYRKLVNKKRKLTQSSRAVQIYIDQPYLSNRRQKQLLYQENAERLTIPVSLHACDVQQFIMFNLFGRNSMYRPRWCSIQFVTSVTQIAVIVLEGISWMDVNLSLPSTWSNTHQLLGNQSIRMKSSHLYEGSLEEDLFMVPLPAAEIANSQAKPTMKEERNSSPLEADEEVALNSAVLLEENDAFPRTMLLLPFTELAAEGFPLPSHQENSPNESGLEGFEFSKDAYTKVTDTSPMYAIDCEMVHTCDDRQSLASICVVDEKLNTIYSTLVKPESKVKDYLTRYSGITKELLKHVTTTAQDVQSDLRKLLPTDAILCGQSLNNDLMAMKLYHPYVIDTSVCYNLKGMPHSKTALKKLAAQFLKKEIQVGTSGHCPEEDAKTTMELILLKLKIGFRFGNVIADGTMAAPPRFFKVVSKISKATIDSVNADNKSSPEKEGGSSDNNLDKLTTDTTAEAESKLTPGPNTTDHTSSKLKNQLIPQLAAFSKRTIPQFEVNMFDLVGHKDDYEAVICTQCSTLRSSQNDAVTTNRCEKTKQVIKKAKRALKSDARLVYANIKSNKDLSSIGNLKKHSSKMDEEMLDLWDCLKPRGLFCLILSGTKNTHGSLMFGVKPQRAMELMDAPTPLASSKEGENDTDVYAMMYGCG